MRRSHLLVVFVLVGLLFAWSAVSERSGEARSDFDAAVDFVRHASSERHLTQGHDVFLSVVGEKRPSDWVAFFLSALSTGNWVTARELDEMDGWGAVRSCPLAPDEIVIVSELDPGNDLSATDPRERYGRNRRLAWRENVRRVLVVLPDDGSHRIRVRGYTDWNPQPEIELEWEFPRFSPVASD